MTPRDLDNMCDAIEYAIEHIIHRVRNDTKTCLDQNTVNIIKKIGHERWSTYFMDVVL